jgi:hypothetical protein
MSKANCENVRNRFNQTLKAYLITSRYQFTYFDSIFGLPGPRGNMRAKRIQDFVNKLDLSKPADQTKLYSAISALSYSSSKILKNWVSPLIQNVPKESIDEQQTKELSQQFEGRSVVSRKVTIDFSFIRNVFKFFDSSKLPQQKNQKDDDIKLTAMRMKKHS